MPYVYRITWPNRSYKDVAGPREAVEEIRRRYPDAKLPKWTVFCDTVNLAAIDPLRQDKGVHYSTGTMGKDGWGQTAHIEIVETDGRLTGEDVVPPYVVRAGDVLTCPNGHRWESPGNYTRRDWLEGGGFDENGRPCLGCAECDSIMTKED